MVTAPKVSNAGIPKDDGYPAQTNGIQPTFKDKFYCTKTIVL